MKLINKVKSVNYENVNYESEVTYDSRYGISLVGFTIIILKNKVKKYNQRIDTSKWFDFIV